MRNSFFLGLLMVVLCSGSGAPNRAAEADGQAVAGEAALSTKDMAAIKTLHDAYQQAVLTGGLKATVRFYADDAVLMARGPVVQGRAAFEKSLEGMSKAFPTVTAFNMTLVEIDGRGDLAFVRGTLTMSMASAGAPQPVQFSGKFLEILRKQKDGSWLIAREVKVSD